MIHSLAEVYTENVGENTKIWQYSIILEGAIIGEDCNINCHTLIESKAIIGDRVTIKPGVYLWDGIILEDDVMIGPNATFTNDKWPKSKNTDFKLLSTLVKKGASIGANATILCGITIGAHALIGAGTMISKNIPDRALVIGNPGRIIGWMNEDGTKMKDLDNDVFLDKYERQWKVLNEKLVQL